MHRRPLLDLLDVYQQRHPEESACVEKIRALAVAHENCFQRDCQPGHITASSWIVSHDHQRVLFTHHRKLDRWLQLGGHADGDTDVLEVALKEAREESGMNDFDVLRIFGLSWLAGALALPSRGVRRISNITSSGVCPCS